MIIALNELPPQWGYQAPHELPPEVITGLLKHCLIFISPELETTGGLKGTSIKLPTGGHRNFLQTVARAKHNLRKGEIGHQSAVGVVQQAAESEVNGLAELVRRYAADQVAKAQAKAALGVATVADNADADSTNTPTEDVCTDARAIPVKTAQLDMASLLFKVSHVDVFMDWLANEDPKIINNR